MVYQKGAEMIMTHRVGTNPDCPYCSGRCYQIAHTEGSECVWCANLRAALQGHGLPPDIVEGILTGSKNYFEGDFD